MTRVLLSLTLVSALGCGLIAGVLFAFSAFVMPALNRLPPAQGIAAMQSINVAAVTPPFMLALFGTAATCVVLALSSLVRWTEPGAVYVFVGSALYLVGTILVTIVFNVPLNDALAVVAPESAHGASLWVGFVTTWTAWNHVRAVAALAATASYICQTTTPRARRRRRPRRRRERARSAGTQPPVRARSRAA